MSQRWIHFLLICSLPLLIAFGLWTTRRPLCIDSRLVERIDRISIATTERIWRCGLNEETSYSPWVAQNLNWISSQVSQVERALSLMGQPFRPLRLTVVSHRPWVFRVHERTIFIGEKLLHADGHLLRGLLKVWLREQSEKYGEGELREEVFVDFLAAMISGHFRMEDPLHGARTRLGGRWPFILKEAKAYCASPWRLSEHYELCEKEPDLFVKQASLWSLRPLLSSALIQSWRERTLSKKTQTFREVTGFLAESSADIFEQEVGGYDQAFSTTVSFLNDFDHRIGLSGQTEMKRIRDGFFARLKKAGFDFDHQGVSFDLLVLKEKGLSADWMKDLADYSRRHPNLRIAIRRQNQIIVLPSMQKIEISIHTQVRAQRLAVFRCGETKLAQAMAYHKISDRVLFLEACELSSVSLAKWAFEGVESFATEERGISFVQVYMPSLLMKKDDLDPEDNLFLVQNSTTAPKIFGWDDVIEIKKLNASRPRAALDAIEWFRVKSL